MATTFVDSRLAPLLAACAFMCLLSGATGSTLAAGRWPGAWPPQSSSCTRNNNVDFSAPAGSAPAAIDAELTRVHADPGCVPQPRCVGWIRQQRYGVPYPNGIVWQGRAFQTFSIADQDAIIATARAAAAGMATPGRQFYRLTFATTLVPGGPGSAFRGRIIATAYYGACVGDLGNPTTGNAQQ